MDNTTLMLVVTVTGILVVFAALVLLTFSIKIFGNVVYGLVNSSKDRKPKKEASKGEMKKEPIKTAKTSAPAPVVQDGISGEVVAAIAAAVATLSPDGAVYSVRSIRRASGNSHTRPIWGTAGVMDNTRPF